MKKFVRIVNSKELNLVNKIRKIPTNFEEWLKKNSGESTTILKINEVPVEISSFDIYNKGEVVFLFDLSETSPDMIRGIINNRIGSEEVYALVFSADLNVQVDESNVGWKGAVVHYGEIRLKDIRNYEAIEIKKSSIQSAIDDMFVLPK